MTYNRWDRVKEIFGVATPLGPSARSTYLAKACGGDSALRLEVEHLLAQHDAGGGLWGGEAESEWILSSPATKPAFAPDEILCERFRVMSYVGRGGMGEVYEVDDLELGGRLALKTLRAELLSDERNIERFKREVQLARQVTDPHVCRIFDVGRHRGEDGEREYAFLTMEYLPGETLAAFLKRSGRLGCEQAWPLVLQIGQGLNALHRAHIIHRDLKPGNIMLSPGSDGMRAVITDFGLAHHLARENDADTGGTGHAQIVGTLDYMAPEQLTGQIAGPATDIYAFGIVLYEMLTGARPFSPENRWTELPSLPKKLSPEIPKDWDRCIRLCLETNPERRLSSMGAVFRAFGTQEREFSPEPLAGHLASGVQRTNGVGESPGKWLTLSRRHVLVGLSAAAAAGAGLVAFDSWHWEPPDFHTSNREAAEAFENAQEAMRAGRYQDATDRLRDAIRSDPAFALAHIIHAKIQITLGEYVKGHESAQIAYNLVTRNPEAYSVWDHYRVLGGYKHLRREFNEARKDLRALAGLALEHSTRSWFRRDAYLAVAVKAFRERALIYSFEGFPAEAQKEIHRARVHDPENVGLDVLESLFLVEQADGQGALEIARRAWRRVSSGENGAVNVYPAWAEGMAYLLLDEPELAREAFRQLSQAKNEPVLSAWGRLFEAKVLVCAGDWSKAVQTLRESDTPDRAEWMSELLTKRQLWLAELAALIDSDWREELRRLEELAGREPAPQNVVVFRNAALLAAGKGDHALVKRFRRVLEEVESNFPSLKSSSGRREPIHFIHHHAQHARGEELRLNGQLEEARRIFSDEAKLFLRDPRSWLSLARLQAATGYREDAIKAYRRVLSLKGQILTQDSCTILPLAHLELARCFRSLSRFREARQSYDRFLKQAGSSKLAAEGQSERNALPR